VVGAEFSEDASFLDALSTPNQHACCGNWQGSGENRCRRRSAASSRLNGLPEVGNTFFAKDDLADRGQRLKMNRGGTEVFGFLVILGSKD
jgi:hypothetical protein